MARTIPYLKYKFDSNNKFLNEDEYKKIKQIGEKKFISEKYNSFNLMKKEDFKSDPFLGE